MFEKEKGKLEPVEVNNMMEYNAGMLVQIPTLPLAACDPGQIS